MGKFLNILLFIFEVLLLILIPFGTIYCILNMDSKYWILLAFVAMILEGLVLGLLIIKE